MVRLTERTPPQAIPALRTETPDESHPCSLHHSHLLSNSGSLSCFIYINIFTSPSLLLALHIPADRTVIVFFTSTLLAKHFLFTRQPILLLNYYSYILLFTHHYQCYMTLSLRLKCSIKVLGLSIDLDLPNVIRQIQQ